MNAPTSKSLDDFVRELQTLSEEERSRIIREACAAAEQPEEPDNLAPVADPGSFAHELIGSNIGPYRVLGKLGEGGMGEVVLAERADEQFQQRVAIKLVRRGMLSRHVQSRLRLERQILAKLDHPNIARLLDGGTTTSGVPYIVMEYVEGEPIDAYCNRRNLDIKQRLRLFQIICGAVHRAHQNLIVHRDLKSSNILVTADGTVKLLDFGIAKLLDENQATHTLAVTHADYRMMTPSHASPEQIRGEIITTASDIYGLGVLLYELLTGCSPYALHGNRLAEVEQAICEHPALAPTEAIRQRKHRAPTEVDTITQQRAVSLGKLTRELRGELQHIMLMALRKEPERRYSSVEQFAADVQRYLDGMPLIARPDTWSYRTRKFIVRHAVGVSVSTLLVLLLTSFTIITLMISRQVQEEREASDLVTEYTLDLFRQSTPSAARGRDIGARELLYRGSKRAMAELSDKPKVQARILNGIGSSLYQVGDVASARQLIESALAKRRLLGNDADVAESLVALSEVLLDEDRKDEAEVTVRAALRIYETLSHIDVAHVGKALCRLGRIQQEQRQYPQAKTSYEKCHDIYVKRFGKDSLALTEPLDFLARIYSLQREYPTAAIYQRRVLALDRQLLGADSLEYASDLQNLATTLHGLGQLDEAEEMYRQALTQLQRIKGAESTDAIDAMSNLAWLLKDKSQFDEAERLSTEVVRLDQKIRGPNHSVLVTHVTRLASIVLARRDLVRAEGIYREALAIAERAPTPDMFVRGFTLMGLSRLLIEAGRASEAEPLLAQALKDYADPTASYEYALARAIQARAWATQGDVKRAAPQLESSYAVIEARVGPRHSMAQLVKGWLDEVHGKPPVTSDRPHKR